jgi:cytidylate kinase
MPRTTAPVGPALSPFAERQMRSWALGLQTQRELAERKHEQDLSREVHPYVAITREAGIDDDEVARHVADQLHWKILGREMLDHMADEQHWSRAALDSVDERTASWFNDTLGHWLDRQLVSQVEYVHRLAKIVILAAHHESMIFMGRGAQFLLPPECGVTVRLVAPRKWRIKRLAAELACNESQAADELNKIDEGRVDFVQRYYHRDVRDSHLYDLVINMEHATSATAADLITHTCNLRFQS